MKELQDLPYSFYEHFYFVDDDRLLDYVWDVADHFLPDIDEIDGSGSGYSRSPSIFCYRYHSRNETMEQQYQRYQHFYDTTLPFEEFVEKESEQRRLDDSFLDRYLQNEELQRTIQAFGLDQDKFWYLLLFVYDYVEDLSQNSISFKESEREELDELLKALKGSSCLILRNDKRQCFQTNKQSIIRMIQSALLTSINNGTINCSRKFELKKNPELPLSYKKWYFANLFRYFLRDKTGTQPVDDTQKVSLDKMLLISRLIYTVGYDTQRYNEAFDKNGNKNRMLSNLLRKYEKQPLPFRMGKVYW